MTHILVLLDRNMSRPVHFITMSISLGSASKLFPKYALFIMLPSVEINNKKFWAFSLNGSSFVWAYPTVVYSHRSILFFCYDQLINSEKNFLKSPNLCWAQWRGALCWILFFLQFIRERDPFWTCKLKSKIETYEVHYVLKSP